MTRKTEKEIAHEKQLISSAQKDTEKFGELYDLYYDKILRYLAAKVNRNIPIAEDLTSVTFEKALLHIKNFRWQGISFSAWIYRIANNTLIDYYRKESIRKHTGLTHDNYKDSCISIEESAIKNDSETRIRSLIDQLNSREQEIVRLKFYEGLSNIEIAEKTGLSDTNVGTIVYRAMKKLQEMILSRPDINME